MRKVRFTLERQDNSDTCSTIRLCKDSYLIDHCEVYLHEEYFQKVPSAVMTVFSHAPIFSQAPEDRYIDFSPVESSPPLIP